MLTRLLLWHQSWAYKETFSKADKVCDESFSHQTTANLLFLTIHFVDTTQQHIKYNQGVQPQLNFRSCSEDRLDRDMGPLLGLCCPNDEILHIDG